MKIFPYFYVSLLGTVTAPYEQEGAAVNVIAIVAQKAGVGKTTISQCLAVEALRQGIAAAIIDTDPQKSAAEWGNQREQNQIDAPAVLPIGSRPLKTLLEDLKKRGAQLVVIDTPPHSAPAINAAFDYLPPQSW